MEVAELMKYLQDSSHTWVEIVTHCEHKYNAASQALRRLEEDGRILYDCEKVVHRAAGSHE